MGQDNVGRRFAAAGHDGPGRLDRWIGLLLLHRLHRCSEVIEHENSTLIGPRVFGIALGYDLNDRDQLRHDPMMAILAGKLEARRADCAPRASRR
jgi:hypothetical protein